MDCVKLITSGITKNCADITGAIGVEKDLILVNHDEVDVLGTLNALNREADDTNGNEGGLTAIKLLTGATQYTFEGTDYSVVPSVAQEVREDGDSWFIHTVDFKAYSKVALTRKTIETLGRGKVLAIAVDRSTGLYEIFGLEQGLRMSGLDRAYTGSQDSNFYKVTLATPDIAVIRESSIGELAVNIEVAV